MLSGAGRFACEADRGVEAPLPIHRVLQLLQGVLTPSITTGMRSWPFFRLASPWGASAPKSLACTEEKHVWHNARDASGLKALSMTPAEAELFQSQLAPGKKRRSQDEVL